MAWNWLHALWVPIAFRFAPVSLGFHSLRGLVRQLGVDPNRIPNSALRELAADAYKTSQSDARLRDQSHFVCFGEWLEGYAAQIVAGFQPYQEFDPSHKLKRRYQALEILRRHGMRLPIDEGQ